MNSTIFLRQTKSHYRFLMFAIFIATLPTFCCAHSRLVHQAIANSAALSSSGLASFLVDNGYALDSSQITFANPDVGEPQSPIKWIMWGAFYEDNAPRWGDHFYTVTPTRVVGQAKGLTDSSESLGVLPGHTTNSYAWAAVPNILSPFLDGNPPTPTNTETWECARAYELAALTNNVQADREASMAHMLYALGHVLHLNEDLSSPDHVRNDEHPLRAGIEHYGKNVYLKAAEQGNFDQFFPHKPHGWLYWQDLGFSKVQDFWDRGHFMGGSSALDADANGTDKLGLAEFSNGNFLGEDALYAEYFSPGDQHYFPFPSLRNTVQGRNHTGTLLDNLDSVTLENLVTGNRVYVEKDGAGIHIQHHSVLKYLGVRHPGRMDHPDMRAMLTVNDPNVLKDYHDNFIPKAVEYSAGILDYFFRGTFRVQVGGSSGDYTFTVQNNSGQDFSGGSFFLFEDDTSGNRAPLQEYPLADPLPNNGNTTLTYSGTVPSGHGFFLVYKGTIGIANDGTALDPADAEVAIAVADNSWRNSFESDNGSFQAHEGDYFCGGWYVDSGSVDIGNWGSDGTPLAYQGDYFLDLDGSEPGTISIDLPTKIGQAYRLSFAWTRNTDSIHGYDPEHGNGPYVPTAEVWIDHDILLDTLVGNFLNSPTPSGFRWQYVSYTFTATHATTTLTFHSTSGDADSGLISGIHLDAVSVTPIGGLVPP